MGKGKGTLKTRNLSKYLSRNTNENVIILK
jgi:hypothetical protein